MNINIEVRGGSWQWGAHCKSEGQLRSPMAPQCAHIHIMGIVKKCNGNKICHLRSPSRIKSDTGMYKNMDVLEKQKSLILNPRSH